MMAMSYGNVYVAQVAMGADKDQTLRAIAEAEPGRDRRW
jgi:pyruvate-ferredoxin/flavodoxin oxidoreductase